MALPIILAAGAWGATKFGAGAVKGVAGAAAGGVKGAAGGVLSAGKFIASLPKKIIGTLMNGPAKILGFLGKIIGKPLGLLGISTSISSLLRQSQIFTGSIGALLQMVGAFIDIMLAPFMPYFASLMKKMGTWIPKIQEFSLKFHEYVVNKVFPWLKGLPQKLVEHFGGTWSTFTDWLSNWWKNQNFQDWVDNPMGMFIKTWNTIAPWLRTGALAVIKTLWTDTIGGWAKIRKVLFGGTSMEGDEKIVDLGWVGEIQKWWKNIDWSETLAAIGFSPESIKEIKETWAYIKDEMLPGLTILWEDLKVEWEGIKNKWGEFKTWFDDIDWQKTADALTEAIELAVNSTTAILPYLETLAKWAGKLLPKEETKSTRMADYVDRMVGSPSYVRYGDTVEPSGYAGMPGQLGIRQNEALLNRLSEEERGMVGIGKYDEEKWRKAMVAVDGIVTQTKMGAEITKELFQIQQSSLSADLGLGLGAKFNDWVNSYVPTTVDQMRQGPDTSYTAAQGYRDLQPNIEAANIKNKQDEAQAVIDTTNALKAFRAELTPMGRQDYQQAMLEEKNQQRLMGKARDEDWEIRAAAAAGHF